MKTTIKELNGKSDDRRLNMMSHTYTHKRVGGGKLREHCCIESGLMNK
jgi:hypothetical protein